MRKFLSLLLVNLMLFSFTVIVNAETQQEDTSVGTVVEFGSYPQTQVTDEALVTELDAATPEEEAYFEDYWCREPVAGSLKHYDENEYMMKYKDVTYNNEKYRGIKINSYRPWSTKDYSSADSTYQDENGYKKDIWYWFKYEPLKWIIFDADRKYAISELSVDSQPFNNESDENGMFRPISSGMEYANDFCYSHIKNYLNSVFINVAFTSEEQEKLKEINLEAKPIGNDDEEYARRGVACCKVVLPTYEQVLGREEQTDWEVFFFAKDVFAETHLTDYAKIQGVDKNSNMWWLATPGSSGGYAYYVSEYTEAAINVQSVAGIKSVRPVICLENVLAEMETETEQDNGSSGVFEKDSEKDNSPAVAEGECNENISWKLSEKGTLTISGEGKMPEWNDSKDSMPPWYDQYSESIKNVVIEDNITSVGKLAFYGCRNLQSVTIPESVTYIGECAFNECDALTVINYSSDEEAWAKIEINDDNIDFNELTINYNVKSSAPLIIGAVGIVALAGASAAGITIKKRKKKSVN